MAYFAVHVMSREDAEAQTVSVSYNSIGFDESIHRAIFLGSAMPREGLPQLSRLRVACWGIFEKYFDRELDELTEELRTVRPFFALQRETFSVLGKQKTAVAVLQDFEAACLRAKHEGKGIIVTGD